MSKKIIERVNLNLDNRDGALYAVKADDDKFYLVLVADTLHYEECFDGMGSTSDVEITEAAFRALNGCSLANVE